MLFPDWANAKTPKIAGNTNYTVDADCLYCGTIYDAQGGEGMYLYIDGVQINSLINNKGVSDDNKELTNEALIFPIKKGSIIKFTSNTSLSRTFLLVPLVGGGVTTYSRLRHDKQQASVSRNQRRLLHSLQQRLRGEQSLYLFNGIQSGSTRTHAKLSYRFNPESDAHDHKRGFRQLPYKNAQRQAQPGGRSTQPNIGCSANRNYPVHVRHGCDCRIYRQLAVNSSAFSEAA